MVKNGGKMYGPRAMIICAADLAADERARSPVACNLGDGTQSG
jgi:hypothetical protein